MKLSIYIYLCLVLCAGGTCQTNSQPHIATSEEVISNAITFGAIEGQTQKQVARMGDAAAVSVTRVIAEKNVDKNSAEVILIIIRSSFADPSGIQIVSDREPRTALFVLHSLERSIDDAELKKKITDTKRYIQEQFRKYKLALPQS